jgi:general secretion pathway protein M
MMLSTLPTAKLASSLRERFDALALRERRLLLIALGLITAALLWWIALKPALLTYQNSQAAHASLDAQLAKMQTLAQDAQTLKAAPRMNGGQARVWLENASKKLGKAVVSAQGNRLQISFVGASPEALASFLTQARSAAQLVPVQANWQLAGSTALWDGTAVFEVATP